MLSVVCVNHGNYLGRGEEYVQRLHGGIKKFLPAPYSFHVFTEDNMPDGLSGWWAKLWLFAPFNFEKRERVLYIDLDTIITGPLDDIAKYDGPFTVLQDFYRPFGLGSGLMTWTGNECADIWENWIKAGCPKMPGGDQQWIEMAWPQAERWQEKLPGQIVSYKVDCQQGVPKDARVVCFHGRPRPHEIDFTLPQTERTKA